MLLIDNHYWKNPLKSKKIMSRQLYIIFDTLDFAHRIIEKSPTLRAIPPKPPRVDSVIRLFRLFRNPKTLRDKLIRSKLKPDCNEERRKRCFYFWRNNCDICNILEPRNEYISATAGKLYKISFVFIVLLKLQSTY